MAKLTSSQLGALYSKNASSGGTATPSKYQKLGASFSSSQDYANIALETARQAEDKRRREAQDKIDEQNKNIEEYKAKQQGFIGGVKSFLGMNEPLKPVSGASPYYQAIQQSTEYDKNYNKEWLGRAQNFTHEKVAPAIENTINRLGDVAGGIGGFKSMEDRKKTIEAGKGAIKSSAELASGVAKFGVDLTYGMSPYSGYSTIRKVSSIVGNKKVEQYLDRNTPEYQKATSSYIDNIGILNYHPDYANEYQKTGGEIADIGSWFIPLTRSAKIEQMLSKIPKMAEILGTAPKVVKSGGKFFFEVGKDVVDVAVLDALRGKDADTILEDAEYAGIGGTVIRGAGKSISSLLEKGRKNKIISQIETSGLGKMSSEESSMAQKMISENKTIDDIHSAILDSRYKKTGSIEPDVKDEVPTQETTPTDTKPTEAKPVESPLLQEAKKAQAEGKTLEEFLSTQTVKQSPIYIGKESILNNTSSFQFDKKFSAEDIAGAIEQLKPKMLRNQFTKKMEENYNFHDVRNILEGNPPGQYTKSQLTDLWKQSQGEKIPTITESKAKAEIPKGKSESPIINRINEDLDKANKLDPLLDTTSHKEQLPKAEKEILANPEKVYNETVFGTGNMSDSLRTSRFAVLMANAKLTGDKKAIAEIGAAVARHGRRSGQEVEMIKAMIEGNPTNEAIIKLARTKLDAIASRFKKLHIPEGADPFEAAAKAIRTGAKTILKKERVAKMDEAKRLIKSLICT